MHDLVTVNDLIQMLQKEVKAGNGNKLVKVPKIKLKDIENTMFSADIGIAFGMFQGLGDCILIIGD